MTRVEAALRRIVADLALGAHGFALVGGFAISARTEPRFTRDIDLVMAVADDEEAEQVLRALRANATGDDLAFGADDGRTHYRARLRTRTRPPGRARRAGRGLLR